MGGVFNAIGSVVNGVGSFLGSPVGKVVTSVLTDAVAIATLNPFAIVAAVGSTLGAVGAVTGNQTLSTIGTVIGAVGAVGGLANAAGLIDISDVFGQDVADWTHANALIGGTGATGVALAGVATDTGSFGVSGGPGRRGYDFADNSGAFGGPRFRRPAAERLQRHREPVAGCDAYGRHGVGAECGAYGSDGWHDPNSVGFGIGEARHIRRSHGGGSGAASYEHPRLQSDRDRLDHSCGFGHEHDRPARCGRSRELRRRPERGKHLRRRSDHARSNGRPHNGHDQQSQPDHRRTGDKRCWHHRRAQGRLDFWRHRGLDYGTPFAGSWRSHGWRLVPVRCHQPTNPGAGDSAERASGDEPSRGELRRPANSVASAPAGEHGTGTSGREPCTPPETDQHTCSWPLQRGARRERRPPHWGERIRSRPYAGQGEWRAILSIGIDNVALEKVARCDNAIDYHDGIMVCHGTIPTSDGRRANISREIFCWPPRCSLGDPANSRAALGR